MDAITKESKEWLAALALVPGNWKGRLKCDHGFNDPHLLTALQSVTGEEQLCKLQIRSDYPPDITPDLLYAIRETIAARGYRWELCGGRQKNPKHNYTFFIEDKTGKQWITEGNTEADAIIRAAASLQEAK